MSVIEQKLDTLSEHIADLRVSAARMATSLEEHVRRTNLLESRVEQFAKAAERAQGIGMAAGALGWIVATAAAILEVWRTLHAG
jgi:hypothetical protein